MRPRSFNLPYVACLLLEPTVIVMRHTMLALLVTCLPAMPLAAQFEGTVHMRIPAPAGSGDGDMAVKIAVKGDMQAMVMQMPASAGPMAGMEMRTIIDAKANTATVLIPLPAGMPGMGAMANAKGVKSVTDLSQVSVDVGAGNDKGEVKKLGTKQKIAGLDCDDYEITQANVPTTRACITHEIGRFVFPGRGGMVGRGGSPPAWSKAFGNDPGFPLKVWGTDGGVLMETISVDKRPVAASAFEIPEGYVDMSGMMRGRGGL